MDEGQGMGTLRFTRGISPILRSIKVFVDGELAGRLWPFAEISLEVEPGTRQCKAALDSSGSPTIEAVVRPGNITTLRFMRNREGDLWDNYMSEDKLFRVEME